MPLVTCTVDLSIVKLELRKSGNFRSHHRFDNSFLTQLLLYNLSPLLYQFLELIVSIFRTYHNMR